MKKKYLILLKNMERFFAGRIIVGEDVKIPVELEAELKRRRYHISTHPKVKGVVIRGDHPIRHWDMSLKDHIRLAVRLERALSKAHKKPLKLILTRN